MVICFAFNLWSLHAKSFDTIPEQTVIHMHVDKVNYLPGMEKMGNG